MAGEIEARAIIERAWAHKPSWESVKEACVAALQAEMDKTESVLDSLGKAATNAGERIATLTAERNAFAADREAACIEGAEARKQLAASEAGLARLQTKADSLVDGIKHANGLLLEMADKGSRDAKEALDHLRGVITDENGSAYMTQPASGTDREEMAGTAVSETGFRAFDARGRTIFELPAATASTPAVCSPTGNEVTGNARGQAADREALGRVVAAHMLQRVAGWNYPWEQLPEHQREACRCIADAVVAARGLSPVEELLAARSGLVEQNGKNAVGFEGVWKVIDAIDAAIANSRAGIPLADRQSRE